MEALILSCGTGGGHNAAAAAIRDELERRGHRCQLLNPYTLDGAQTAKTVDHAYVGLVQHAPGVFGLVYCIGGLYQRLPFRSPVYFGNAKTAGPWELISPGTALTWSSPPTCSRRRCSPG